MLLRYYNKYKYGETFSREWGYFEFTTKLIKVIIQKQDSYEQRQSKYEERQQRYVETMNSLKQITSDTQDKMDLLKSDTNNMFGIISNNVKTQIEYIFSLNRSIINIPLAQRTDSANVH